MNNRIIKFRAWDGKGMLFEFGNSSDLNEFLGSGNQGLYKFMQFTGLTDKNGKEIFEGDIVKSYRGNNEVAWRDSSCGFEPFSDNAENCGHCGGGLPEKDCEVIGNVFENPELLT